MTARRPTSFLERVQLATCALGLPANFALTLEYPASAAPSTDFLKQRLVDLQLRFPSLHSRLELPTETDDGFWVPGPPFPPEELLTVFTDRPDDVVASEIQRFTGDRRRRDWPDFDRPFFQVGVHSSGNVNITLTLSHVLFDGIGGLHLLQALVAPPDDFASLPDESDRPLATPTIEQTPLSILSDGAPIPEPEPLSDTFFPEVPTWPFVSPKKSALTTASTLRGTIPTDLMGRLRTVSKARGIGTLGPVLHGAFAVAMWSVLSGADDWPFHYMVSNSKRQSKPFAVGDDVMTHPYTTGNYIGVADPTTSLSRSTPLWDLIESHRDALQSPESRGANAGRLSSMFNIPLALLTKMLVAKVEATGPYSMSALFANLAYQKLSHGASDLVWSQQPWLFVAPMVVSLIGSEAGTHASVYFHDGAVVTADEVKRVLAAWRRILDRISEGYEGNLADA